MPASDVIRGAVLATIAGLLLTGSAELWHLVCLMAVYGTAEAFFRPAQTGLTPSTVGAEHLQQANAAQPLLRTGRAKRYPAPDGKLTFDKLSSVFASGNRTRDDQPSHIRVERRVPREVAELWSRMCPAHVYEVGEDGDDGLVTLEVTPSNCVQCGAITARGGRLTPPEGGSGPEYTLT